MRKLMFALALVGLSTSALAQDGFVPVSKYRVATNSFWANWFVSAGVVGNATFSSQEPKDGQAKKVDTFSKDRAQLGFTVAIGKWFTPVVGFRTKFDGIWGNQLNNEDSHPSYKYWNIQEDVMFNLSNLFAGYNETRVWNTTIYAGPGVVRNMDRNLYDFSLNAGWLNTWRISNKVGVYADLYATFVSGDTDGNRGANWERKKNKWRHWDKIFNASIGLTYNLGKSTWDKVPDVDALMAMNKEQMDALNRSLKDLQDENARLREMLANVDPGQGGGGQSGDPVIIEKTVNKFAGTAASVFFNIGSSKIASKKDLINVEEVANFLKNNSEAKVLVTGYADSKTGNTEINNRLSQARAEAVANELVKMGISRDRITTDSKGGVNTLTPASYNRRATVEIK